MQAQTGRLSTLMLCSHLRTSITVEIVSPGPSRATIEARPERAADRAPAHGRTSLPPRGPVGCCRRGTRRPRRLIGKCRAGAAAGNVSAEGEAIRSNDYRKDTTVKAPSTRPAAVLGLDVGKSSHWACLIDRDGEVLASAPVRNREAELDALFASAPAGTLVVVDQFRNIGSLAVRRARAAGLGVAHLPGLAASRAAGLFAGEAIPGRPDIGGPRRGRGPRGRDGGAARGRRDLRVSAHRARHRPEDRGAARGVGRHREVPGPRPPGLVLRHSPEGEELRHVGEVGQGVQARRREAQVPADLLVQQPGEVLGALRRVLPGLQGAGHGARAGAQGRREEAAQGDIRRDARPGALPGVAPTVDKTIGTPNDYFDNTDVLVPTAKTRQSEGGPFGAR